MTTIRADIEAAADILMRDGSWGLDLFPSAKRTRAKILAAKLITASDHARLSQMPEVAEMQSAVDKIEARHADAGQLAATVEAYWPVVRRALDSLSTLQSALERKDEALRDIAESGDKFALGHDGEESYRGSKYTPDLHRKCKERARAALATQPKEKA